MNELTIGGATPIVVTGYLASAAAGLCTFALIGYLAFMRLRVRLTHRRAAALLSRQRGTGKGVAVWSLRDWEWAYTRLGTRVGLEEAARCRMLQDRDSRGPGKTAT